MQLIVIEVFIALGISAGTLIGLMVKDCLAERRQRQRPVLPHRPASGRDHYPAMLSTLILAFASCAGAHLVRS